MLGPYFVMLFLLISAFLFCNHHAEEEKAGCFTLYVFLLLCGYLSFCVLSHGAMY